MSKITAKRVKGGSLEITGRDHLKNAPEKLPSRRSKSEKTTINISDLENVTGSIVGRDRVEFREKDFKTALATLERVISASSLDKEKSREFRELTKQIRQSKPGIELSTIQSIWKRIVQIVNIAGLASGTVEKLLSSAWRAISGYLGLG